MNRKILFGEVLKKYEDSERYIIGETSSNIDKDIAKLESEIEEYQELWEKCDDSPSLDDETDPLDGIELGNLLFGCSRGNFRVDRFETQDMFHEFMDRVGLDGYGYADSESPLVKFECDDLEYYKIDTPVFSIMPYYWGDDEKVMELPNFVYKPENIEINWYKHPMRDAYSNVQIDKNKLREILEKCIEYLHSTLKII